MLDVTVCMRLVCCMLFIDLGCLLLFVSLLIVGLLFVVVVCCSLLVVIVVVVLWLVICRSLACMCCYWRCG